MNNEQINECADSIFSMVEEQIQDTIEFYIESKEVELEENKIFAKGTITYPFQCIKKD